MTKWIELEKRFRTKQTIDKYLQEQINREKEHWEKVLLRIIAIIKYLFKNNFAFHGANEKIYEKGKGLFNELVNVLKKYGLNIDDIRGQGYDNGSNMKGIKKCKGDY
ncbi:uncharacterized protein LOC127131554 [Lathyrus oleraceus]|uniref:uncharacterized protein LOC127131554 n=1 Tax=Pisum sativum TaxID=3888 RepID=UPI0021CEE586|nr:uncharacterized protein LOC127131554 [Pisum sativum]